MNPATIILRALLPSWALLTLAGCGGESCSLAGCESTVIVDYGSVVVNEPYELVIDLDGAKQTYQCLAEDPEAEPLPEWLSCDAGGFEATGDFATTTTVSVLVVPLSTQEAPFPTELVPLMVQEELQPNGPDCEPTCYVRRGQVPI